MSAEPRSASRPPAVRQPCRPGLAWPGTFLPIGNPPGTQSQLRHTQLVWSSECSLSPQPSSTQSHKLDGLGELPGTCQSQGSQPGRRRHLLVAPGDACILPGPRVDPLSPEQITCLGWLRKTLILGDLCWPGQPISVGGDSLPLLRGEESWRFGVNTEYSREAQTTELALNRS